jgi:nicotinamidase-related amidase
MTSSLDPSTTALVLIDLQHGITALDLAPHPAAQVVANCARLAEAYRSRGAAVVYVRVALGEMAAHQTDVVSAHPASLPPNACQIVPEAGMQPGDTLVTKRQWGAFYATELDQVLRRRGIKTLVMAGIATNIGVESTARAAFDQGYDLVFAEDAMSTFSAEMQDFALTKIFPRMGRVRSTEQLLTGLTAP